MGQNSGHDTNGGVNSVVGSEVNYFICVDLPVTSISVKKLRTASRKSSKLRPLWSCPECGERFVTRNIWHSCGKYTLEELFARSEPHVLELFKKFEKMVRACGTVRMIPQKTRICFQARTRFAGAVPRKSHLLVSFALPYQVNDSRFAKIEKYASHFQIHTLRVCSDRDLDKQIQRWLRESYEIGAQSFLLENDDETPTLFKRKRRTH